MRINKNSGSGNGSNGNAKVNLIILQMEGETSMLAKSIDSFVHAMTMKPNGAQARVIGASPGAAAALQPSSEAEEGDENAITAEPPSVHEGSEAAGPSRQRSGPPKRKLVAALNIADGDMPFAKFCEGKDPKDWAAKIVLGGIWMRDHRERAEFNADDIYTCLRHQWTAAPEDLPQMLRDMTRRELLDKGATRGGFKLSIMSDKKLKQMDSGG